jgi:hypothetical protein
MLERRSKLKNILIPYSEHALYWLMKQHIKKEVKFDTINDGELP